MHRRRKKDMFIGMLTVSSLFSYSQTRLWSGGLKFATSAYSSLEPPTSTYRSSRLARPPHRKISFVCFCSFFILQFVLAHFSFHTLIWNQFNQKFQIMTAQSIAPTLNCCMIESADEHKGIRYDWEDRGPSATYRLQYSFFLAGVVPINLGDEHSIETVLRCWGSSNSNRIVNLTWKKMTRTPMYFL